MTDGLTSVQMRIAAIQQQIRVNPMTPAAPTGTSTSPTSSAASFAAALDAATASANGTASTTNTTSTADFANGKIPESALFSIGGGEKLAPKAAENFIAMKDAATRSGVSFAVNDSYRSYEDQVDMANRKGLYSQGGLAAKPGTSTHGLGLSVDLELDAKAQSWMKANGGTYGFVNDVKGEPWHWTFKG